jgi:repressor LexA
MYLTRRQREILDYLKHHVDTFGYAPTLVEIARHFHLGSIATVHKHLSNLQRKGLIRRSWNRSRSVEIVDEGGECREVPLYGRVAAGRPIEAVPEGESIAIPTDMLGRGRTYVLRVSGDSMVEEGIRDGDYVIVEDRKEALNGETVVALLGREEATLKKYYRQGRTIRLEPANPRMEPITADETEVTVQGVVIGLLRKYRRTG